MLFGVVLITGCKHEAGTSPLDEELFRLATNAGSTTWYKHDPDLLDKSSGSGHNEPFLRTRYNDIAATVLDGSGKVLPDSVFPTGSLIVKELWSDPGSIGTYAIMLKRPGSPSADAGGWLWGYLRPDGSVRESALNKGSACRGCHTQAGQIDATLMNKYFP